MKNIFLGVSTLLLIILTFVLIYFQESLMDLNALLLILIFLHSVYYYLAYFNFSRNRISKLFLLISLLSSIYVIILLFTYLRFKNYGH